MVIFFSSATVFLFGSDVFPRAMPKPTVKLKYGITSAFRIHSQLIRTSYMHLNSDSIGTKGNTI